MKTEYKMKAAILSSVIVGISLLVSIVCCGTACLGAEEDAKLSLERQLGQLEAIWAAGKTNEYWAEAVKIAKAVVAGRGGRASTDAAGKVLEALSTKEFGVKAAGTEVLPETKALVMYLANNDKATGPERQTNAALLARYLGRIRSERVPDYHWLPVVANVGPPAGATGIVFAGMNPETISDPVVKSNYLSAIQKNQENNLANKRQALLEDVDRTVSKPILQHMIDTIQRGDVPPALAPEWMSSANLDAKERKEIRERTAPK